MNTLSHEQAVFSIAAVERDTGLSKDTLRVWERRYGFPAPARNANGERLYPQDQLDRLRLIRRLLDAGHRPARIVAATAEELADLVETLRNESVDPQAPEHDATLLQCVCLHRAAELAARGLADAGGDLRDRRRDLARRRVVRAPRSRARLVWCARNGGNHCCRGR